MTKEVENPKEEARESIEEFREAVQDADIVVVEDAEDRRSEQLKHIHRMRELKKEQKEIQRMKEKREKEKENQNA